MKTLCARLAARRQRTWDRVEAAFVGSPGRRFYVYGDLDRATGVRADRLYPILARMERQGLVASGWDPDLKPDGQRRQYWLAPRRAAP